MTKYAISASYNASSLGFVELPEGKTWDDIESWFVKWDTFHYVLKGSNVQHEASLNSDSDDGLDWKRPNYVTVHPCDKDGDPDFNEEIAEQE